MSGPGRDVGPLSVLVDALACKSGQSGILTHGVGVARGLAAVPGVTVTVLTGAPAEFGDIAGVSIVAAPTATSGFVARSLWREARLRSLVARTGADVVLATVPELVVARLPVPQVMVVHDVGAAVAPALYGTAKRLRYELLLRAALTRADRVVCVTHATLLDLHRWSGFPRDRCAVIGNAPQAMASDAHTREARSGDPFLLVVGNLYGNKNTGTILEAVAVLRDRGSAMRLEMVGPLGGEEERRLLADVDRLGLHDLVHHNGFVAADALAALYRDAQVVVYPSLYEGQGIPLLEAAAFGTPIVATDLRSVREAEVEGITVVSRPLDPVAWADAISTVTATGTTPIAARGRGPRTWEDIGGAFAELLHGCRRPAPPQPSPVSTSEKR